MGACADATCSFNCASVAKRARHVPHFTDALGDDDDDDANVVIVESVTFCDADHARLLTAGAAVGLAVTGNDFSLRDNGDASFDAFTGVVEPLLLSSTSLLDRRVERLCGVAVVDAVVCDDDDASALSSTTSAVLGDPSSCLFDVVFFFFFFFFLLLSCGVVSPSLDDDFESLAGLAVAVAVPNITSLCICVMCLNSSLSSANTLLHTVHKTPVETSAMLRRKRSVLEAAFLDAATSAADVKLA
jgi:hypothetical protein